MQVFQHNSRWNILLPQWKSSPFERTINCILLSSKVCYKVSLKRNSEVWFSPNEQCHPFLDTFRWLSLRAKMIQECCLLKTKQDRFVSGHVELCPIPYVFVTLINVPVWNVSKISLLSLLQLSSKLCLLRDCLWLYLDRNTKAAILN